MFKKHLPLLAAAIVAAAMFTPRLLKADDPAPQPPAAGDGPQHGPGGDAQQPRGPRLPPELSRALSQMTLTDDQKSQIKKIGDAFRKKQEALKQQLLIELKKVLTDDQYKQVEESFKQPPPPPPGQGGQGDQGGGGGGGQGPGDMPPPPPNN